jgi:hypothetical protein
MQWPVSMAANAEQEIAESGYPTVRLFTVKRTVADQPQKDTEGSWVACSPETVKSFSAVGYFFGRYLHKELGIPVGLIHSSEEGRQQKHGRVCQLLSRSLSSSQSSTVGSKYWRIILKNRKNTKNCLLNGSKMSKMPKRKANPNRKSHNRQSDQTILTELLGYTTA